MGAQLGGSGSFSDINMTPLIDIVLVVLIIMMVNIPIQIEHMGVKLPSVVEPPDPDRDPPKDQLVIAVYPGEPPVDAEGKPQVKIALNRRAMDEQKMLYELQRRLRNMSEKRVFVDAHHDVEYGSVIDMVDLAKEAGAAKVGLAKMKPNGPLPINDVDVGGMPQGLHFNSPTVVTDGGDIDEAKADQAIQALKRDLTTCYARALTLTPSLSGNLNLVVEVGPQGELLSEVELEGGSMDNEEVGACIQQVVQEKIRFAPLGSQKTAAVRYGILFSPG